MSLEDSLRCLPLECINGSCSDHLYSRRGGNVGEKDSQCEPWRRTPSLACCHALVQAQISGGTGGVDIATLLTQAHQEVAVMQWELTLVEHESKFSEVVADSVKTAGMRAMLPKDTLERFYDGLHLEGFPQGSPSGFSPAECDGTLKES